MLNAISFLNMKFINVLSLIRFSPFSFYDFDVSFNPPAITYGMAGSCVSVYMDFIIFLRVI